MELRFTDHALRRMRQRGIDAGEVAEVLADSDDGRPSEDDPRRTVIVGTTPTGRELFVVVTKANPLLVVTVAERRPVPGR
jgi:Domain of unknown function (DUF4258)